MRRLFLVSVCLLLICSKVKGQSATPTAFQSQAALATHAGEGFHSVTLAATAEWYAGSQHETGTAQLKASSDGSSEVQLSLGQASRTEAESATNSSKTCSWTDQTGTSHNIPGPNCFIALPWFAPSLFTQPLALLPQRLKTSDDGDVTTNGTTMHQVSYLLNRQGGNSASTTRLTNWTKVRIFYDPQTFLPASLEYVVHSDHNDIQTLDVRVMFSNYQSVSGTMLPFHIEKYVHQTLQLKLDVTTATIE